jgi:hypothetical protein
VNEDSENPGQRKIVEFPQSEEERARRLRFEVERLAQLPVAEWLYYLEQGVANKHGIETATFKKMIETTIKVNEKKAREDKAEDRIRGKRKDREEDRKRRDAKREQDERRREQERADREAERKRKEREKELRALAKLPRLLHEASLTKLAERLGEDLDFLRSELETFIVAPTGETVAVEPWPEPVDLKELLKETTAQIRRYVVIHDPDAIVAVPLWITVAWVHEVLVHSPLLEFTSAEGDCGKSTLCGVLKFLTPRAYLATEITGPNLYRFVDHVNPTMIIDDADKLFPRKPDLVHIVNASWTRGFKIPRQENHVTRWFDPFCPKVISGANTIMPPNTRTRCITVDLMPKLEDEMVEDFNHADDDTFVALRSKFARFAIDHAVALKSASPNMAGLNNRARMNWKLQVAVADLAGGDWPKKARAAAITFTRERADPSERKRVLRAFQLLEARHGPLLLSNKIGELLSTVDDELANFRGKGRAINKFEVAALLKDFSKSLGGIRPGVIHPRGRPGDRGYDVRWPTFQLAFKHFLRATPALGRTLIRKPQPKKKKK